MSSPAEAAAQSLMLIDLADDQPGLTGLPALIKVTHSRAVEIHASSSGNAVRIDAAVIAETWRASPDLLLFNMEGVEGTVGGDVPGNGANGTTGKSFLLKSLVKDSRQHLDTLQTFIKSRLDRTYYAAIMGNFVDFQDKVVMDVGAGSGILSLFAAQAGARMVYAVEASDMAGYCRRLAGANPGVGDKIKVLHSKIEDLNLHGEKVDILISEPMGTLLVNERMLETYVYARDHFLKPNGRMFPQSGRIYCAAFTDDALFSELAHKATFWQQKNFFGVDLSTLHAPALEGYFSQVVVDAVDPRCLVCQPVSHQIDFCTVTEEELHDITLRLQFPAGSAGNIHGLACWFDVDFQGSADTRQLSTAPGSPVTHWFQLRCVMTQPLTVFPGAEVFGTLKLVAHARQSYDIYATLGVKSINPHAANQQVTGKFDLKEPYYRQLIGSWWQTPSSQSAEGPSSELPGCM
ncbi:g1550 [Coccomyxa viridis]|uniref:type I protein arginine methyltransferase n=1 Tax=Coccomyxa viridis TaxID=1274662 RepID=A0ABP1FNP2_9CHLO